MRNIRGAWPLTVGVAAAAALLVAVPLAGAATKPPKKTTAKAPATSAKGAPSSAAGRLPTPGSLQPAGGVSLDRMPVFTWGTVASSDHYEFEVAADKGFNSVIGGSDGLQATNNTAATVGSTLANGTYWWRVRSVAKNKTTSAWSTGRSVAISWAPLINITGPANGTAFSNPAGSPGDALILRWAPMPGAVQYRVSIASDPVLANVVIPGGPVLTDATSFSYSAAMPDGTYYWNVTPIDAGGHPGIPSAVHSFAVQWNSSVPSLAVTDIASADSLMAPRLTWGRVAGASGYQIEISTSSVFAAGSKVCCDFVTTSTAYGPMSLLADNTYYWRVRPLDAHGNAGPWTTGPSFTKSFDDAGITNLQMRDMSDIGQPGTASNGVLSTPAPVVTWDPVIGAAEYRVEVDRWNGTFCDPNQRLGMYYTGVPSWTPLGTIGSNNPPTLPGNPSLSQEPDVTFVPVVGYSYCVGVNAVDADTRSLIDGPQTWINGAVKPAFTYTALTTTNLECNGDGLHEHGYLCVDQPIAPIANGSFTSTPSLFTWKPVQNAAGYYVVVARDPHFHTILDFAYTNVPAYAPRFGTTPYLYPDETVGSQLYWAVLPTVNGDGSEFGAASSLPTLGSPRAFDKTSLAPSITSITVDANAIGVQWTPLLGAAVYDVQIATDPNFSNIVDSATTDSPSYAPPSSLPASQTYYLRVRADDGYGNGLAWGTTTFAAPLAVPVVSPPAGDVNPASLNGIPTYSWGIVPGAVNYDFHVDYPNGTSDDFNSLSSTVAVPIKWDGTGVWRWRVRAEFPKADGGTVPGGWTADQPFTRTFGEPVGSRAVVSKTQMILSWEPEQGAKQYHLQVSTDPDFQDSVEDVTQDGVRFAPTLTNDAYKKGGDLYWRVQAIDAEGNQGDWSTVTKIALAKGMTLITGSTPAKGATKNVKVTIKDLSGKVVKGVTVRVSGAGTTQRAKQSDKKGIVTIKVHPTKAGNLTFRATKAGYQLATIVIKVK